MAVLEDEFGDVVAKARVGRGLSVQSVADTVGISAKEMERIEAYQLVPGSETVRALAGVLELDAEKLLESASGKWAPQSMYVPDGAIVEQVSVSYKSYSENAYILGCRESGLAAVVDPGGAADEITRRLTDLGLKLAVVMVTHAHADHIGGIKALATGWPGVRLVNHQLERDSITRGLSNAWEPAKDRVAFHVGKMSIVPVFTPGHTPGSVCYRTDGLCFVGDTLFAGSIGRPAGPAVYQQMLSSVSAGVLSLPEDTVLLPGHGPATTVGEERAHNPFF